MTSEASFGRVLILNGASSAGKSTLARALQAKLTAHGTCWVIFSWDDFVPRLPWRWRGVPGLVGDLASDGCRYRLWDEDGEATALLEVGALGRRMLSGYHRAVADIARAGINVVVEEVMITAAEWDDWNEALADVDTRWVGIRCDLDVVTRRERERGDRYSGLARGTTLASHRHARYDLEVDTSEASPEEVAQLLERRLGGWLAGNHS